MCPLIFDLPSVTFDPETAEIRSVIVTHPMKIQHFCTCWASHKKITKPRPTELCDMLGGLCGLQSTDDHCTPKYSPRRSWIFDHFWQLRGFLAHTAQTLCRIFTGDGSLCAYTHRDKRLARKIGAFLPEIFWAKIHVYCNFCRLCN